MLESELYNRLFLRLNHNTQACASSNLSTYLDHNEAMFALRYVRVGPRGLRSTAVLSIGVVKNLVESTDETAEAFRHV